MRVRRSGSLCGAVTALLLGLGAGPAAAQTVTFSDRAAFTGAATGLTTLDFEGAPEGSLSEHHSSLGPGLTLGGARFTPNTELYGVGYLHHLDFNYEYSSAGSGTWAQETPSWP